MQPVTSETRVRSHASSCANFGGQISIVIRFIRMSRFFLVTITSPMLHNMHMHVALARRTSGKAWAPCKANNAISEMGDHWIGKYYEYEIITYLCYSYFHLLLMSTD